MNNNKEFDQLKYIADFNEVTYDRVTFRLYKGEKALLFEIAKDRNTSVNNLIRVALCESGILK